ncbi:hypothetical protein QQS21_005134 [Conoideocrella luteorostrata]|uniref:Methyltransferase type 11 domain-containing protein n=1 Tax=Conoideocrella luteorostrata TaxID=1105319 RepID=A0AAJ0FUS2_9HYPO|nr:hypothetical protein QQS21_005134 [Conoideocrella luteorostrata]
MDQSNLSQAASILRSHECVEDAVVLLQDDLDGEMVAFLTLRKLAVEHHIQSLAQTDDGYESQQVELWETVFDEAVYPTIENNMRPEEIGRDFHGWISAYDGSLLGSTAMQEWLDDTMNTILSCNGDRPLDVLELGTGSGMILFNMTKRLRSYLGIELTQAAVEFVTATAKSMPELANKVRVRQGAATDLHLFESASPEVVIINSVAQYFPSREYLLKVVENILRLKSVRTIIFGDIRSHALREEFFVSKALCKLGGDASKEEVGQKVAEMARAELELLTDPAFFTSLQDRFSDRIAHVEILPKKMKATNELSCYRYTAVIHVMDQEQAQEIHHIREEDWIDFAQENLDYDTLCQRLASAADTVAVRNIPFSKIMLERRVVDSLHNKEENVDRSSGWLASVSEKSQKEPSLSPVDLVDISRRAGRRVEMSWARQHTQRGGLDAIFHRFQESSDCGRVLFRFPTDHQGRAHNELTNQPLEQQAKQAIQQELYELLEEKLSSDMMPEEILILDQIPKKGDGEVDRQLLSKMV